MPSLFDYLGRNKSTAAPPASLVDVLAALPSAASVPTGTRAYAIDKQLELVAVGGVWLAAAGGAMPIGIQLPYVGDTDPGDIGGGITFLLADGRLISRTTYAAFFARCGHKYNGGVDPGSSMVRLPDKRFRGSVGADNMGTAQGAAGRGPSSNRAAGQNGGEERHVTTIAELPSHGHIPGATAAYGGSGGFVSAAISGPPAWVTLGQGAPAGLTIADPNTSGAGTTASNAQTSSVGGGGAHNNMAPYEVDNWIVRVA